MIGLGRQARELVMSVADDGTGFDAAAVGRKGTLGLISMREQGRAWYHDEVSQLAGPGDSPAGESRRLVTMRVVL